MRAAVFLDRDGVINEYRSEYVRTWEELRFLPGAMEAIARLTRAGIPVVVVTNQSGIGRGVIAREVVDEIHRRMGEEIAIAAVMVCPHHPDDACECRKPKPGMLRQAARELE